MKSFIALLLMVLFCACVPVEPKDCLVEPELCLQFGGPGDAVLACEEFCALDCATEDCSEPPADCHCDPTSP